MHTTATAHQLLEHAQLGQLDAKDRVALQEHDACSHFGEFPRFYIISYHGGPSIDGDEKGPLYQSLCDRLQHSEAHNLLSHSSL